MTEREIDAAVAQHCLGWTPPARKIDSRGDRGWGQYEQGGPWRFCVYGDVYDDTVPGGYAETLLEEISDAEFRARYLWRSPKGEYVDAVDCMDWPPVHPVTDPVDSKQLRERMVGGGWDYTIRSFHSAGNMSGAEKLAAIFESHFAGLPSEERAVKEQAFDKSVAGLAVRHKRTAGYWCQFGADESVDVFRSHARTEEMAVALAALGAVGHPVARSDDTY